MHSKIKQPIFSFTALYSMLSQLLQQNLSINTSQFQIHIAKTVKMNIQLHYQGQYTHQNIQNILKVYKQVYQIENQQKKLQTYQKLTKQFQHNPSKYQNQIKIIKWIYQQRACKFDGYLLKIQSNYQINQQYLNYKRPFHFCSYIDKLVKIKLPIQNQIKSNEQKILPKLYKQKIQVNKNKFWIQTALNQNQLNTCSKINNLIKEKSNGQVVKTCWIVQITKDGRYIWRANGKIDHIDIEDLLIFILRNRRKQLSEFNKLVQNQHSFSSDSIQKINTQNQQNVDYCPSVIINYGSRYLYNGSKAVIAGNQYQLDLYIVLKIQDILNKLLILSQQHKLELEITRQNIRNKVYLFQVYKHITGAYPLQSNHIIDCQCFAAYSPIDYKSLIPYFRYYKPRTEQNLDFLYQRHKIKIPSIFHMSYIIDNRQIEDKMIDLFNKNGIVIKKANIAYRGSKLQYSIQDQIEIIKDSKNLIYVCMVINNDSHQMYGGYSEYNIIQNGCIKLKSRRINKQSNSFTFYSGCKQVEQQANNVILNIKGQILQKQQYFLKNHQHNDYSSNLNKQCHVNYPYQQNSCSQKNQQVQLLQMSQSLYLRNKKQYQLIEWEVWEIMNNINK